MNPRLAPLILASSSPRRQELLQGLGEPFAIQVPEVEEDLPPGPLEEAVQEIARRKARAVAGDLAEGTVLAADTVVEVGGQVLGKPRDAAHAHAMLKALSGSRHRVLTGVAVRHQPDGTERSGVSVTWLEMREITEDERRDYVASGEPFGKAGAYAVQETADRFVVGREGPFDNVVGLPMDLVRELLEGLARALPPGRAGGAGSGPRPGGPTGDAGR